MKKPAVKTSKGEIGRVRIVEDFLPSPDRLVLREQNVKVTLSLSQRSVAFFKRAARQRRVPYQRMIRALVDAYAEKQGREGVVLGNDLSPDCAAANPVYHRSRRAKAPKCRFGK